MVGTTSPHLPAISTAALPPDGGVDVIDNEREKGPETMAARAEMSTNAQGTEPRSSAPPKGMSVALIGPNDAHRQVVVGALASGEGRKVHEFIDYPATLNDLARMMETRFDVVLVDVDTDESYALQIITKLAELGPAVMAYSARTDEDLVASCMRAGASDFLPLPTEHEPVPPPVQASAAATQSAPKPQTAQRPEPPKPVAAAPKPAAAVPQPAPSPVESRSVAPAPRPAAPVPQRAASPIEAKPAPIPSAPASRLNVTPIAPQKFAEPEADTWPPRVPETRPIPEPEREREAPDQPIELDILKDEAKSDFAAWDAAHLRRASMPPVARPDTRPRPSLVPEKRRSPEPVTRAVPVPDEPVKEVASAPPPMPVIERPPISTDIFRSSMFHAEPSEAAEKQGAKWVKWMLIAAGPVVLGLVLLVVFTRSTTPGAAAATKSPAASASNSAPAPEKPDPTASDRLIVNATGKPGSNAAANTARANSAGGQAQPSTSETQTEEPKQISPDAMAAQLVAPARLAGQINARTTADEPPPAPPSAVALEDNNSVPGALFESGSKMKVTPRVVPISAGLATGMLIHKTTPVYPKFAQEAHITGSVVMKATITKQGTIEGIQVLNGPKILAPAAVDAVKTWKYRPYMLDGQPVAVETNVTVVFGGK